MSSQDKQEVFTGILIIGGLIFGAALAWQILVTNHSRNVERDKYLFANCENVREVNGLFSTYYTCEKPNKD